MEIYELPLEPEKSQVAVRSNVAPVAREQKAAMSTLFSRRLTLKALCHHENPAPLRPSCWRGYRLGTGQLNSDFQSGAG